MNREEAINIVKPQLKQSRFDHTLRVTDVAKQLAEDNGASVEKAELAAILHDYAKYFPLEEMKQIIKDNDLPSDLLEFHHELWHGPAAYIIVEQEYGITDPDVRNAIYYHTTGKANMSLMETILFVADYIEPGRSFPGVEEVREMAYKDLYRSAWMALRNTIQFLVGKHDTIYPDTFEAYNDLTMYLSGGSNKHG